ncbi:MAG TPA: mechanosensitive ion channel family protein [Opitutaceae bacterium]|nr:mechanosensitive ion channel family protein [Opitutaceae bacterium]
MNCLLFFLRGSLVCGLAAIASAQTTPEAGAGTAGETTTTAAAAVAGGYVQVETPDLLEHLVDLVLGVFDIRSSGNTPTHYAIAALFLVGAVVLRRLVTRLLFGFFRRLAARTRTTLDDKLFPALETPVGAMIALIGAVAALKVLKLSATGDQTVRYVSTMAFSLVIFWLLLRAFNTLLEHLQGVAQERQMGIAAFMPWIRKTLLVVFVVFGVLLVAQSLGADVKAFLAGLGIGGLAFALAAQDTLANVFGSVVVAVDQPFKIGEFVRIGGNAGVVEDIGLRSTKLRGADKSLTIVPNKTVASEPVVNLSRFTQRRVEQVIGLTYSSSADAMQEIMNEFKAIILAREEVDPTSVMVFFRDFAASSLDIWIVYLTKDADFQRHMLVRQEINLALMRAVEAKGLSFAFPSQSVYLEGEVGRRLRSAAN